jgi:hypothetical protein
MLFQTLAMALYNSSASVMAIIEQSAMIEPIFSNLVLFINRGGFQLEFEIRRVIFGLISLIKNSPQLVN